MINQKMYDAAHHIAFTEGDGVTDTQIWTVLQVGLPWCMTGVPDAAHAAGLDLCVVDMMLDAAITTMSCEERHRLAYNYS